MVHIASVQWLVDVRLKSKWVSTKEWKFARALPVIWENIGIPESSAQDFAVRIALARCMGREHVTPKQLEGAWDL